MSASSVLPQVNDTMSLPLRTSEPKLKVRSSVPTTALSSLERLSDELLLGIFEHFEWETQPLRSLCLVSKRVRGPAEDMLYRSIDLAVLGSSRIMKLWMTLCRRDQVPRTRNLRLHFYSSISSWKKRKTRISPADLAKYGYSDWNQFFGDIDTFIENLDCQWPSDRTDIVWRGSVHRLETSAFASMLLFRLPSLEYLDLRVLEGVGQELYTPSDPLLEIFSFNEAQEQPNTSPTGLSILPHITHLRVHMNQGDLLALGFPRLRTLEVDSVSTAKIKWKYSYPCLQKLIVRHDPFPNQLREPPDFQRVVELINWLGCFSLISFELLVSYGPCYTREGSRNFRRFVSNLAIVSSTLEELKIDIIGPRKAEAYDTDSIWSLFNNVTPVKTLSNFKKLNTIKIAQRCLVKGRFGPPISALFPPSLESLTVYWPDTRIAAWLQDLLSSIDKFQLKQISLRCRDPSCEIANCLNDTHSELLDEFRQRGVFVQVVQEDVKFQKDQSIEL